MKLDHWLSLSKISDADFAQRIRVSRQALWRYKAGDRIPRPAILARIQIETNNAVMPADFFGATVAPLAAQPERVAS